MILATRKNYICSVNDMEIAALINDMVSLQIKGKEAKTNFNIRGKHVWALLQMQNLLHLLQK